VQRDPRALRESPFGSRWRVRFFAPACAPPAAKAIVREYAKTGTVRPDREFDLDFGLRGSDFGFGLWIWGLATFAASASQLDFP
jgi:hypothetical protein